MRVSRYALLTLLWAMQVAAPAFLSVAAGAQETSKPEEARASGGAGAESKSAPSRVPKDILVVNPCKAAHPPAYCNVRN
jgi:hypothetical protein